MILVFGIVRLYILVAKGHKLSFCKFFFSISWCDVVSLSEVPEVKYFRKNLDKSKTF